MCTVHHPAHCLPPGELGMIKYNIIINNNNNNDTCTTYYNIQNMYNTRVCLLLENKICFNSKMLGLLHMYKLMLH